jgi:7,8-dihydro-6-hydroxymethylpterin dimethyltransferase
MDDARVPRTTGMLDQLYYETRSLCPVCNELAPGRVVPRGGQVFVERTCPRHGFFEGLTCSDREWYERLPLFFTDATRPRHPLTAPRKGCPEDCGLCAAHTQIAGTAAIEISNVCNGACPACLANNQGTFELSVAEVGDAVNAILRNQDHIDTITLSGGEPTIHPQLFEILASLQRPEIGRIAINSNGIRIARDEEFVKRLAETPNIYVSLHYDGPNARSLRGVDHSVQVQALEQLAKHGVDMAPVVLAAKGVNERDLGSVVEKLFFGYPAVKCIIISLMTYTGSRGATFPGDPLTRLTIPEALDNIGAATDGRIKKYDFMPLPMPNPMCAAIGHFLLMDNQLTPLIPFGEIEQVVRHMKNGHFGTLSPEFGRFIKDTINNIWSQPDKYPGSEALLRKFRRLLQLLFPNDESLDRQEREKRAGQHLRIVYLMQFMDSWTFDSKRLSRCSCQHVLPGGKIVSSCGYYSYHRRFDPRFPAHS